MRLPRPNPRQSFGNETAPGRNGRNEAIQTRRWDRAERPPVQFEAPARTKLTIVTSDRPAGHAASVLPDRQGRMKRVALQFDACEGQEPLPLELRRALLEMYRALIANLSPDARFTIAVADDWG